MRPFFVGVFLFLLALAQAGAGISAAGGAPAWVATPLWLVAMCGFMSAALAVWGLEALRPRAAAATAAAAVASSALQWIAGISIISLALILVNVALAVLVRWWARCSHPE
ncbi:MAG: hypothetical protein ABIT38_01850, partial [Gemmatimonadaceae bacterium]